MQNAIKYSGNCKNKRKQLYLDPDIVETIASVAEPDGVSITQIMKNTSKNSRTAEIYLSALSEKENRKSKFILPMLYYTDGGGCFYSSE